MRVQVDPAAEWRQAFDEAGRLMRDHFWRTDMNGVDWAGVLERYRPLVDMVNSHDELVDLMWEVQGELGTSHAYVTPPGDGIEVARRLGLLGADLVRDGDVLASRADPARRVVRPEGALTAARARRRGTRGRRDRRGRRPSVDPVTGPSPLLAGTADKPVELADRAGRRRCQPERRRGAAGWTTCRCATTTG